MNMNKIWSRKNVEKISTQSDFNVGKTPPTIVNGGKLELDHEQPPWF